MQPELPQPESPRPLTIEEHSLARWMLEHGAQVAEPFLTQLAHATATNWRCPCGCASYNFLIAGLAPAPPGVHPLADFVFGNGQELKGIFIHESAGILSGVELVGYGGDAPTTLPEIAELRSADSPSAW